MTTPQQEQQAAALDATSKLHADPAKRLFIAFRARALDELAREQKTKRQVLDAMHRKYERLRAAYLRIPATTYEGWLTYGPQPDWDEVIAAAAVDAVWDRLVERCTRELRAERGDRADQRRRRQAHPSGGAA